MHFGSHPAVLVSPTVVQRERGGRALHRIGVQQGRRLHQHLKSVADAEHQFAVSLESGKLFGKMVLDLVAEDSARPQIVAVAEPAGDAEDLEPLEEGRILQQSIDVQGFGFRAGPLKSKRGFRVAIRAGGAKDQDVRLGHQRIQWSEIVVAERRLAGVLARREMQRYSAHNTANKFAG